MTRGSEVPLWTDAGSSDRVGDEVVVSEVQFVGYSINNIVDIATGG